MKKEMTCKKPMTRMDSRADRIDSWEWKLLKGSVSVAERNVEMAKLWLGGETFSSLGTKYNLSPNTVRSHCWAVIRAVRNHELMVPPPGCAEHFNGCVPSVDDAWNAAYLSALERIENESRMLKWL